MTSEKTTIVQFVLFRSLWLSVPLLSISKEWQSLITFSTPVVNHIPQELYNTDSEESLPSVVQDAENKDRKGQLPLAVSGEKFNQETTNNHVHIP